MATKKEEVEILEAEILDELLEPDWDFEEHSKKKPRGTRKKDFTAFSAKTRSVILATTKLGAPLDICADSAGVALVTVQDWLMRGRMAQDKIEVGEEDDLAPVEMEFADFYQAYIKCSAYGVIRLNKIISDACEENPNLAIRWLEKIRPDHYAPRQQIDTRAIVGVGVIDSKDMPRLARGEDIARRLSTNELKELRDSYKQKKQLLLAADTEVEVVEEEDE